MLPENQSNELELKMVKPFTSPLGGDANLSTYVARGSRQEVTRFRLWMSQRTVDEGLGKYSGNQNDTVSFAQEIL